MSGPTEPGSSTGDAIATRVGQLKERLVELGGDRVQLVVVTKGFGPDTIEAVAATGHSDVGESYVQEFTSKWDALPELLAAAVDDEPASPVRWHMIGQLQTNKVRHLAGRVHLYHAVDRPKLVVRLAAADPGASILIQVNLAEVGERGGCSWGDVEALCGQATDAGLNVRGVMGVGVNDDPERNQQLFERLVATAHSADLPEVSIGMSGDWEAAVAAGSTMVRVGSAIVGPRPPR